MFRLASVLLLIFSSQFTLAAANFDPQDPSPPGVWVAMVVVVGIAAVCGVAFSVWRSATRRRSGNSSFLFLTFLLGRWSQQSWLHVDSHSTNTQLVVISDGGAVLPSGSHPGGTSASQTLPPERRQVQSLRTEVEQLRAEMDAIRDGQQLQQLPQHQPRMTEEPPPGYAKSTPCDFPFHLAIEISNITYH